MLCFIFNELISQAAGALIIGLVITVLTVGLLFFAIKALADRSTFSALPDMLSELFCSCFFAIM